MSVRIIRKADWKPMAEKYNAIIDARRASEKDILGE
jgi:hypothetical protein